MSLVNIRVVQVDHNFKDKRGMHHNLLVYLHLETEVSTMARIRRTLRLDGSVAQGGSWDHACGRCGKNHTGK